MALSRPVHRLILTAAIIALIPAGTRVEGAARPAFYLASDRSFGASEIPYVNLEGPGDKAYELRVYEVAKPDSFLVTSVKRRLVREKSAEAYGNAISIFREAAQNFKKDFRAVARREFNQKTRSMLKGALGVDLDSPTKEINPAVAGFLEGHRLVLSFSIPGRESKWSYRRIPVPVKQNGVYLVEALSGSSLGYTLIVKSNLSFVTKQSDNETLVFAARRDTGDPVDKAEVRLINAESGEVVATKQTNVMGAMEFHGKTPSHGLIIARKGSHFAISDPDFYARSFYGEGGVRAFIYTDRPVYRPGDTVHFKAIVRAFVKDSYSAIGGEASADVFADDGRLVVKGIPVKLSGNTGSGSGEFALPGEQAIRLGTHSLSLLYKGKSYATEFSVEAYKKPTFKVSVSIPKKSYIGEEAIPVSINAKFFHGKPLSGQRAHYRVFRKKKFDFSPVGSLPFFADAAAYLGMSGEGASELVMDAAGVLDRSGTLEFSIKPGRLNEDYVYSVIASVTAEDSTVSGSAAVSVNRCAFHIRLVKESTVYSPGESVSIEARLVAFDRSLGAAELSKAVGGRKIRAILYTRSFVKISGEGERREVASLSAVTDPRGVARLSFAIPKKGHYILAVGASDAAGKDTSAETALWVSGKSDSIDVPFKNLTLKSSKDIYGVGDDAEILVMTPVSGGHIFVTCEGNRIFKYETIRFAGNSYRYRVRITPAMSPNFTVSVTQFAGNDIYRSQIKVVAPPREKFLTVEVNPSKNEYRPGETAELSVRTADFRNKGVPAEVSIAVVDEAVYQIMEDRNPHIATYFYHPRRDNVNTTLSSAYRFFGYSEAKRLKLALAARKNPALAALKEEEERLRERFKDTCFWSARVLTDAQGKARVRVPLADNLTTWRVTAIAVTGDTRVGQSRASFLARKRFMLQPGTPSYMIRGESHTIAAGVSNLTGARTDGEIELSAEGGEINGVKSAKISVEPGKSASVYFSVTPSADPSVKYCIINLKARSGPLFDGTRIRVPLRFFGLHTMRSASVNLKSGDDRGRASLELPANYAEARLELRLSPGGGEALRQSLEYLAGYPYGCIEQIMSRFMPLLAAQKAGYISPQLKSRLASMTAAGLQLIAPNQMRDGGFGWFREGESDPMMTAYVYRGLSICKKISGTGEPPIMSRARRFLYRTIEKGNLTPFMRAYILFSLSEGGKLERSLAASLSASGNGAYTKALYALVLINQGDIPAASQAFREALDAHRTQAAKKYADDSWESDTIEIAAALLTAAVRLGVEEGIVDELSSFLIINRSGYAWKNSRDTAMAVLALSEKLERYREKGGASEIGVTVNGKSIAAFKASPEAIGAGEALFTVPVEQIKPGGNAILVTKRGGGAVYATAILSFFDRSSSFSPMDKGFSVSRAYYRVETKRSGESLSLGLSQRERFAPGDLVMVALSIKKSGEPGRYIIAEDPLPPGFSVLRQDGEYYSEVNRKEYTDRQIFDDRTVFFLSRPAGEAVIRYFIRADMPGRYRVLPAAASLMYYPDVSGSGADATLWIEK